MRRTIAAMAVGAWLVPGMAAGPPGSRPATGDAGRWAYVAVFDFACGDEAYGRKLANAIRMRLARHEDLEVIDALTTAEHSAAVPIDAEAAKVVELMARKLGANVGLYGTVQRTTGGVRLEACCIDIRAGDRPDQVTAWRKVFQDGTERAEAVISKAVVEAVTGREQWRPPEYGDEAEPKDFGPPLNRNGSFDAGPVGWQAPDNVASFIERGPPGRGNVLRIRTDLERWPYIDYVRAIRMGKASPSSPPRIGTDTSYASLGGMEGVHFKSEWIKATPGQRYWLSADFLRPGGKVFVKGFRKTEHAEDGLSESVLAHLGITPQDFARMPEDRRRKLVAEESRKNPMLFLRECYRWYLNCRGQEGRWNHLAAPFPPRGGLPADVEWLQIQVYSYWPAATYHYDNVFLYKDPRQTAPLPEEKARTPNFGKTSDVIERQTATRPAAPYRPQ